MSPPRGLRLGTAGLTVHYVNSLLGAGILILPGIALETAGPASLLAWVFLIGFCFLFGGVMAQLSVERPDCHGLALFVRCAFGPRWERGIALLLTLAVTAGIIPVFGIAAARRLESLGLVSAAWPPHLVGIAVVVCLVGINLFNPHFGMRMQMWLFGAIVAVLCVAIGLALPHRHGIEVITSAPIDLRQLGMAAVVCFYAVIGWENAAPLAEDIHQPERTLPRAAFLAAVVIGILYLSFAATLTLVVTPDMITHEMSPVSVLLSTGLGAWGGRVGDGLALLLILASAWAWVLTSARMLLGLARNGFLPRWFAVLDRRSGLPIRTAALAGVIGLVMLVAGLILHLAERDLMAATSAAFLAIYLIVMAGALRLLPKRPQRVAAFTALTVLAALACAYPLPVLLAGCVIGAAALLPGRRLAEAGPTSR